MFRSRLWRKRIVQDGIAVELTVAATNGGGAAMEGQDATLTVSLTDEQTGEALPGLTLAAWVDRPSDAVAQEPAMCHQPPPTAKARNQCWETPQQIAGYPVNQKFR